MVNSILYLISLIPLRVLYLLSDVCAFILYHIVKYRRDVVKENIANSFENLNEQDRIKIEKEFYKSFCDNFIETLKLMSASEKEMQSHITADYSELNEYLERNESCHIYLGHQFNWEWANAHIASNFKNENVFVVYKQLSSKTFDNLMLKIRSRFGSKMIESKSLKKEMTAYKDKKHILIFVADQNPSIPKRSFWTMFMSQQTPFISGTELYSASQKTPILFANIVRIKRGQYKFVITPLHVYNEKLQSGQITSVFAQSLENAIKKNPENYLWSHKRWKHKYQNEFQKRWIEKSMAFNN